MLVLNFGVTSLPADILFEYPTKFPSTNLIIISDGLFFATPSGFPLGTQYNLSNDLGKSLATAIELL